MTTKTRIQVYFILKLIFLINYQWILYGVLFIIFTGDIYSPKKDGPKGKNKSPKNRRSKKSPASRKGLIDNGEPKQRKKPGPKPGSKNKPRSSLPGMMPTLEGNYIFIF